MTLQNTPNDNATLTLQPNESSLHTSCALSVNTVHYETHNTECSDIQKYKALQHPQLHSRKETSGIWTNRKLIQIISKTILVRKKKFTTTAPEYNHHGNIATLINKTISYFWRHETNPQQRHIETIILNLEFLLWLIWLLRQRSRISQVNFFKTAHRQKWINLEPMMRSKSNDSMIWHCWGTAEIARSIWNHFATMTILLVQWSQRDFDVEGHRRLTARLQQTPLEAIQMTTPAPLPRSGPTVDCLMRGTTDRQSLQNKQKCSTNTQMQLNIAKQQLDVIIFQGEN